MCDILIIGKGFIGTYVELECIGSGVRSLATTTTGRDGTIAFAYSDNLTNKDYQKLPEAATILITFPLPSLQSPQKFLAGFTAQHRNPANFILLGSTRAFAVKNQVWHTSSGPFLPDVRINIENEFLGLGGCVLNLAGLWGGSRIVSQWISRVADTMVKLQEKTSLHLIHGADVARLVLQVARQFTRSKRWVVTDLNVYDWWDIVFGLDSLQERRGWVVTLMKECGVQALPRPMEALGRAIDSRDVWQYYNLYPQCTLRAPLEGKLV